MLAGRPRVPDPCLTPAVHSSRPGRGTLQRLIQTVGLRLRAFAAQPPSECWKVTRFCHFKVLCYPFKVTPKKLAKHSWFTNPNKILQTRQLQLQLQFYNFRPKVACSDVTKSTISQKISDGFQKNFHGRCQIVV